MKYTVYTAQSCRLIEEVMANDEINWQKIKDCAVGFQRARFSPVAANFLLFASSLPKLEL